MKSSFSISMTCHKDDKSAGCDCNAGSSTFMGHCNCVSGRCSSHPSRFIIGGWDDSVGGGFDKSQRESSGVSSIGTSGKSRGAGSS